MMKNYKINILLLLLIFMARKTQALSLSDKNQFPQGSATLIIHDPYLVAGEKLTLWYDTTGYLQVDLKSDTITVPINDKGSYKFIIPVNQIAYINVMKFKPPGSHDLNKNFDYVLLANYQVNNGDDVTMDLSLPPSFSLRNTHELRRLFTGTGAKKYTLRHQVDSIISHFEGGSAVVNDTSYTELNRENLMLKNVVGYLQEHRSSLSGDDYDRLLANTVYTRKLKLQQVVQHAKGYKSNLNGSKMTFLTAYLADKSFDSLNLPARILADCTSYLEYELTRTELTRWKEGKGTQRDSLYGELKNKYLFPVRDGVIAAYFRKYNQSLSNFKDLFQDALAIVKDKKAIEKIKRYQNRVTGNLAHDFTLPDVSGKQISLSDYKGSVVFIDFWFTGCTFCKKFYSSALKEVEERFAKNPDMIFITISIDRSRSEWLTSVKSGVYTSPKAVNLYTEGKGSSHDIIRHYNVSSYPQPLIIGKDQKVLGMNGIELTEKENLIQALEKALAVN
jgi:thiol-disulfide isomerase/thioredoxin